MSCIVPNDSVQKYFSFIQSCKVTETEYRFSEFSESSPFALCFALFGYNLLSKTELLQKHTEAIHSTLRTNLERYKTQRMQNCPDIRFDKPFLQLLTFTLSCLSILGTIKKDPFDDIVTPLLSSDIRADLTTIKSLDGKPQSGNQSMFIAILLLHAKEHLNQNTAQRLDQWVEMHMNAMNEFGFWGDFGAMTHLQFQNGYHQYEILNYLNVPLPRMNSTARHVAELADHLGHFAPYIGGGGCYDFDAVFLLTYKTLADSELNTNLLQKTFQSILSEQNSNGGFAENKHLKNHSPGYILRNVLRSIGSKSGPLRKERLMRSLGLIQTKNTRIPTHWTRYSRLWHESNLWDSWFRMMTLSFIQHRLAPNAPNSFRYIDYPGIGFHHHGENP